LYSFVGEQNILNVTMYEMFLYQQMLINYLLFHLLPLSKRFLKKKQKEKKKLHDTSVGGCCKM